MKEICENCAFSNSVEYQKGNRMFTHWECRRESPQIMAIDKPDGKRQLVSRWPMMRSDDWCGEWEEK